MGTSQTEIKRRGGESSRTNQNARRGEQQPGQHLETVQGDDRRAGKGDCAIPGAFKFAKFRSEGSEINHSLLFCFPTFSPGPTSIKVVPFQLKEDYERKIRELEEQLQLIMNESERVKSHNNEILQQKLNNDQKINELLRRLEGNLINWGIYCHLSIISPL